MWCKSGSVEKIERMDVSFSYLLQHNGLKQYLIFISHDSAVLNSSAPLDFGWGCSPLRPRGLAMTQHGSPTWLAVDASCQFFQQLDGAVD